VTFSVKLMMDPNIFSYANATSSTSTPNFINATTTTP